MIHFNHIPGLQPTQPNLLWNSKRMGLFSKKNSLCFVLSKELKDKVTRVEVCQLDLEVTSFCPFQSSWRLLLWFQTKIGISKNEHAQPFFKYQQRGSFHQGLCPSPQLGKGQPQAYANKGEHTFCTGESNGSLTPGTLSHIPSTIQPQMRQDNTEGVCCPFLLVVEQSCDGTALMRS